MPKIALFRADELACNEVRQVRLDGMSPIAVYNLNGEFRATADTCTHGDASLAEGLIEGNNIVCPYHSGAFDIRSGEPCGAPCAIPLKVYPLSVENGVVYLLESERVAETA
jgi:nitrite reductase/ring-hydroxylating ferredoxin subunit